MTEVLGQRSVKAVLGTEIRTNFKNPSICCHSRVGYRNGSVTFLCVLSAVWRDDPCEDIWAGFCRLTPTLSSDDSRKGVTKDRDSKRFKWAASCVYSCNLAALFQGVSHSKPGTLRNDKVAKVGS